MMCCTREARGGLKLNRTLRLRDEANGRASSAPFGRGSKNQKFSFLIRDFRRGVWGEPTKNGKEIFGFASPLLYYFCWNKTLFCFSAVLICLTSFSRLVFAWATNSFGAAVFGSYFALHTIISSNIGRRSIPFLLN